MVESQIEEWRDKLLDTQALLDGAGAIVQTFANSTPDMKDQEKFVSAGELIDRAEEKILEVVKGMGEGI